MTHFKFVCSLLYLLLLASLTFDAGCEQDDLAEILRLSPDLDPEFARHLVHDDDHEFFAYCEELGYYRFERTWTDVYVPLREPVSVATLEKRLGLLDPHILRIGRVYRECWNIPARATHYARRTQLPLEMRHARERFWAELYESEDVRLRDEEALARWHTYRATIDSLPYLEPRGLTATEIANCLDVLNRLDASRHWRWQSVEELLAVGNVNGACQQLGRLGVSYRSTGTIDSMRMCYDRAFALAMKSRIPDQAARVLEFYGNYYKSSGNLPAAMDYYRRGIELCRELKGGPAELRFLMNLLEAYADLGCWDVVGRELARGYLLMGNPNDNEYGHTVRLPLCEGRRLAATGRPAAADSAYAEALAQSLEMDSPYWAITTLERWSESLLEQGDATRALQKIARGREFCERLEHPPEWQAHLHVLAARAHLALGRWDAAETDLEQFRAISSETNLESRLGKEWLQHDALRVQLALGRQQPQAAVDRLCEGLERLQRHVVTVVPSAEGYLLPEAQDLRAAMHAVVQSAPEVGYVLEMTWRQGVLALGTVSDDVRPGPRPFSECARIVRAWSRGEDFLPRELTALRGALGSGGAHLVYWVGRRHVIRWTMTAQGIQRDVLPGPPARLGKDVEEAVASMSTAQRLRTPCDAPLARGLFSLSKKLLPELPPVDGAAAPLVLVSADGFLEAFSFEALNTTASGYSPLLRQRNVAYLRHLARHAIPSPATHAGLAVLDPLPPPAVVRRQYGITSLARGREEVAELAERIPQITVLEGLEASAKRIAETWEGARLLYFATHAFRDPEIPYLTYLALSAPGPDPAESFFDVSDVRRADLSGCELVVLSGCATGAPYVSRSTVGASLSDAFLDAGAHAAVQTLWDVRDADARRLMSAFLDHWSRHGLSPLEALCEARREFLGEGKTATHPFNWAAYSIEVARLPASAVHRRTR